MHRTFEGNMGQDNLVVCCGIIFIGMPFEDGANCRASIHFRKLRWSCTDLLDKGKCLMEDGDPTKETNTSLSFIMDVTSLEELEIH